MFGYLYPGGERNIADPAQSQLIESPKNLLNAFPIWTEYSVQNEHLRVAKLLAWGLTVLYSLVKRVLELLEKFDEH